MLEPGLEDDCMILHPVWSSVPSVESQAMSRCKPTTESSAGLSAERQKNEILTERESQRPVAWVRLVSPQERWKDQRLKADSRGRDDVDAKDTRREKKRDVA
ncbi:hypothetical protein MAP00_006647 [Monascus purpureus]|nr:hypothetical protein MAP00_006647 [Monascus purpureus]